MFISPNLLNYSITNARLDYTIGPASLRNTSEFPYIPEPEFSQGAGELQISRTDTLIQIDNYPARSTLGYGNLNFLDFNRKCASKHKQEQDAFAARAVSEGTAMGRGTSPHEIAVQKVLNDARAAFQAKTAFLPSNPPDISFTKPDIDIEYTPTPTVTDFNNTEVAAPEVIKGPTDFTLVQRPYVGFEYLGEPIYVPMR